MLASAHHLVIFTCLLSLLPLALSLPWPSRFEGVIHRWFHGTSGHDDVAHIAASGSARESPPPPPASWIVGAGVLNRTFNFDYSQQMMHRPEVDLVASYLRPDDIYLEFGSGGSTHNFPRLVKRAYSIEHNCAWATYLQGELDRAQADFSNLNLVCVPVPRGHRKWGTISGYEHGNYVQFKEYVDRMDTFPDAVFDRVFIDGRARMACALKALSRLNADSLVFIHDFYARTAHYGGVMEYYIEVARVLATKNKFPDMGPIEEPQGLIVLRPKPEAVGLLLSDEEINKKYNAIDWRAPFAPPLVSLSAFFNYYVLMSFDLSKWPRIRSVDGLLRSVWRDMFVVSVIYAAFCVLSFRIRRVKGRRKKTGKTAEKFLPHLDAVPPGAVTGINWGVLGRWRSASQPGISASASSSEVSASSSDVDKPAPRFFETEAIRIAKARRKKRQVNPFEA